MPALVNLELSASNSNPRPSQKSPKNPQAAGPSNPAGPNNVDSPSHGVAQEAPLRDPPKKGARQCRIYHNGNPADGVVKRVEADPVRDGQPSLDLYIGRNGYWPVSNRSRISKIEPDSAK